MNLGDVLNVFVDMFNPGTYPIPPAPGTLSGHIPNLAGLKSRDTEKIICQLEATGHLDGGDSAHRTGVAAFCNSADDKALLPRFENHSGTMVRHPSQPPWNNPNNCSRDQLKGYSAGCWRAGQLDITKRLLDAHRKRIWTCQNIEEQEPGKPPRRKVPPVGDMLLPDDIMFLKITAGDNAAFMDVLGQFVLQFSIETASRDATADKNNLLLQSIVCGRLNLFIWHKFSH